MRSFFIRTALSACCVLGVVATGCTADIHDNTLNIDDLSIEMEADVDVDNVQQGTSVPVTIKASEEAVLVLPDQTPPPGKEDSAVFFKIFLDTEDGEPLLVTASLKVSVMISSSVTPGSHKLRCRMFRHHDGQPTESKTEITINVKASGSVSTSTDGG